MVGTGKFPRIIPDDGPVQYHKWYWPWACAIAINFVILWVFAATAELSFVYGRPQSPGIIPVTILTESQLAPALPVPEIVPVENAEAQPEPAVEPPEPQPELPPAPVQPQVRQPVPPAADVVLEAENIPEPEPEPVVVEEIEVPLAPVLDPIPEEDFAELPAPDVQQPLDTRLALPQIDLPEVGGSGSSGVVAIFCPDIFDDMDKSAECAGRPEIRSGWMRTDEDWSGITASLRRGGINVPGDDVNTYGPAWRAPLAGNEQYYEPVDQGLIIGRKAAQALADKAGYERLKRASLGVGQTTNVIGQSLENLGGEVQCFHNACGSWEPSWTLRDDPNIDTATIDRIIREGDAGN